MPLLAYGVDGAVHHAWAMSPAAWEELKASYRDRGLTAPCCGAAVVPVRSPTGWQFFRHKPNTGCAIRESLAHIVCKSIMARAAARLGLDVTTEARADDGTWVADVLVRHPDWTVALEAQLSRIPLAAIQDRQERYREAGIRGAWLVGYDIARLEAQRDLPLFRLEVKQAERLEPAVIGSTTNGAPARTDLAKFTEKLLTGRVRFEGPRPRPARHRWRPCRRCAGSAAATSIWSWLSSTFRRTPCSLPTASCRRAILASCPRRWPSTREPFPRCMGHAGRSPPCGVRRPPASPSACARTVPGVTRPSRCRSFPKRP